MDHWQANSIVPLVIFLFFFKKIKAWGRIMKEGSSCPMIGNKLNWLKKFQTPTHPPPITSGNSTEFLMAWFLIASSAVQRQCGSERWGKKGM